MDIKMSETLQIAPQISIGSINSSITTEAHTSEMPKSTYSTGVLQKNENFQSENPKAFSRNADMVQEEALQERVAELMNELNAIYNPLNLNISFGYSEDIQAMYVEVKRIDTGEILRQVPSKEAIKFMTAMREMHGAMFDIGV